MQHTRLRHRPQTRIRRSKNHESLSLLCESQGMSVCIRAEKTSTVHSPLERPGPWTTCRQWSHSVALYLHMAKLNSADNGLAELDSLSRLASPTIGRLT